MRYAIVERIEPTGDSGFYQATIGVREHLSKNFHSEAIIVFGSDLTDCVERVHMIITAFNTSKL